jgi:HD-like signal output (HDOD) protein
MSMALFADKTSTPMPETFDLQAALARSMAVRPFPIIRQTAVQVISLLSKPNSKLETIASTILHDQAFSARVLKLANSAYYRRGDEKITTVSQALLRTGYNTVRELAIAAEFAELVQRRLPEGVSLHRLLAKAVVAAHQASAMAPAVSLPENEALFTNALLETLGEFATAVYLPQVHLKIHSVMTEMGLTHDMAHVQVTGMTSHAASEMILRALELPEELILSPPNWDKRTDWTSTELCQAVVHITNTWATNIFSSESPRTAAQFEAMKQQALTLGRIPPETLDKMLSEAYITALRFGSDVDLDRSCFVLETTDAPVSTRQIFIATCVELAEFTMTVQRCGGVANYSESPSQSPS